jgi:hypothetical protein
MGFSFRKRGLGQRTDSPALEVCYLEGHHHLTPFHGISLSTLLHHGGLSNTGGRGAECDHNDQNESSFPAS